MGRPRGALQSTGIPEWNNSSMRTTMTTAANAMVSAAAAVVVNSTNAREDTGCNFELIKGVAFVGGSLKVR